MLKVNDQVNHQQDNDQVLSSATALSQKTCGQISCIEESRKNILTAYQYLQARIQGKPQVALILGSGLGGMVDQMSNCQVFAYEDIPCFPQTTVSGHAGKLIIGDLGGKRILAMQGRFHYYEGHAWENVVFPIRVMLKLGIKKLILTNAAGGINPSFVPGDLMLITDHLNMMGGNPLIGSNYEEFGVRFPDMSHTYTPFLQELTQTVAIELGIKLQKGVYAAMSGPGYETPAEVRFLSVIGADACGMSTVPEAMVAHHGGMELVGLSCITNMAAGLGNTLDHQEVMDIGKRVEKDFSALVTKIIAKM